MYQTVHKLEFRPPEMTPPAPPTAPPAAPLLAGKTPVGTETPTLPSADGRSSHGMPIVWTWGGNEGRYGF